MRKLLFFPLIFSAYVYAADAPIPSQLGGTGNNNAYGIALGGAINTAGALTFTGAYGVTFTLSGTSSLTLPNGTKTLAANDGSNATGTWGINISGNSATVTNGIYSTGSYTNPTWIVSLDGSKLTGTVTANAISPGTYSINISGNSSTVTNGVYTTDTGTVTNTMLAGSIADSKLNTISTAGKVSNSATTATSVNTASAIVARDSNGDFSAGTISASALTLTNSGTATNFISATATTASSGGTTNLNQNSAQLQLLTGTSTQTYKLPNGSALSPGYTYFFNNNSTGILTVDDSSNGLIVNVPAGGMARVNLTSTAGPAGTWDYHWLAPLNASWGTSTLSYTGSITGLSGVNIAGLTASELVSTDASKNLVSGNLNGDVSTSGLSTTLATVNSNVGSFGDGTHIGAFTVNGKGLITAASSVAITGASPTGSAGGELAGTYPNPTIVRTLNGTFNNLIAGGSLAINTTATSINADQYLPFVSSAGGGEGAPFVNSGLFFHPSTGVLTATSFSGALSGNATTATTLQTARAINGVNFDGSAPITVTAAAGTLTGTTLNSTVVNSSLTSTGIVTSGTWSGSFGSVSGANLTNLTAANISAGIAGINISGNAATATTATTATGVTGGYVASATGTANQVNVSGPTGAVTFSLPQSIATSSTPTFDRITLGTTSVLTGTNIAETLSSTLSEGNYLNFGGGGRNLGVEHTDGFFHCTNLDYDSTAHTYKYNTTGLNGGVCLRLGSASTRGTGYLLYAAPGTAGGSVTPSIALQWDSGGIINIPGLTASQLVSTDSSKNLVSGNLSGDVTSSGLTTTVAKINGNTLGSTTPTNNNALVGDGSQWVSTAIPTSITGTSNQVVASASTGPVTLSLPQSISTTSSVTFGGLAISNTGNVNPSITSTTTGSTNGAYFTLKRGDQANGFSIVQLFTGATNDWDFGEYAGNNTFLIRDKANSVNQLTITQSATNGSVATFAGKVTAGNDLTINSGNAIVNTAGDTLKIKQGSNACSGTGAVMVGGAVTVNTTCAATGDIIFIMKTASGGTSGAGMPAITISNGVSFTLTGGASDTSTWSWVIIKAA